MSVLQAITASISFYDVPSFAHMSSASLAGKPALVVPVFTLVLCSCDALPLSSLKLKLLFNVTCFLPLLRVPISDFLWGEDYFARVPLCLAVCATSRDFALHAISQLLLFISKNIALLLWQMRPSNTSDAMRGVVLELGLVASTDLPPVESESPIMVRVSTTQAASWFRFPGSEALSYQFPFVPLVPLSCLRGRMWRVTMFGLYSAFFGILQLKSWRATPAGILVLSVLLVLCTTLTLSAADRSMLRLSRHCFEWWLLTGSSLVYVVFYVLGTRTKNGPVTYLLGNTCCACATGQIEQAVCA